MFNDLKQSAIAAVGAVILTVTAVGAAVGPARAVETAPVSYVQTAQASSATYA
jgi:hypothetical protein